MINIWTFLFQVINFLVLVWLLKRFLYGPIVEVINRRREAVRQEMADLEARRARLEEERHGHQEQVRALERERAGIIGQARGEGEEERRKILERARQEARQEQEKLRRALEEEKEEVLREIQERVVAEALSISERLVAAIAADSLHEQLVASGLHELERIPAERARKLMAALPEPKVRVVSARPLTSGQRQAFEQAARGLSDGQVRLDLSEEASLGAGVRIEVGELVLRSTLAAQLERVRRQATQALEEREG